MKRFLFQLTYFIFFSSLFYAIGVFVWGYIVPNAYSPNLQYTPKGYGHMNSRMNEVKKVKNVDLLFLGSSHAYRGFDTRFLKKKGVKTFNLGSSSQTPIQTEFLLDRYLDNLNPDEVVYEVYPELMQSDGVESSLDLIANDYNDWGSVKMAVNVNHLKTYNSLLYGILYENIFGLESDEERIKKKDTYINGGFVEKEVYTFNVPQKPKKAVEIDPSTKQLKSFKKVISIIQQRNIELTVVFTPITNYHYSAYNNIDEFDQLIENMGDFKYYNFNERINLNDSLHFYDSHHLNQKGVEIFNEQLIKLLGFEANSKR